MKRGLALLGLAVLLAACTEKPQQIGSKKPHEQAWQGSTQPGFNAPGWKASDQTAWDTQLRTRSQGQNEYVRTGQ